MPQERIFTSFTPEQAAAYANNRGLDYPQQLYDCILDFHEGGRDVLLDIGTGPGTVVFNLLPYFRRCLGCDSGEGMIAQAKQTSEHLDLGERAKFVVCAGEECDQAFPGEKVDLMTVALAAHWLDLGPFYASAAKALKPGGTLAIWTCSTMWVHPSTPNHAHLQAIISDLKDNILRPYFSAGTLLTENLYRDLKMPWGFAESADSFDQSSFQRRDWDLEGVPSSEPLADGSPGPFAVVSDPKAFGSTVSRFAKALRSNSSVIRWREGNPDEANTDEDVMQVAGRKLLEANGGRDELWMSPGMSLLLLRRS